MWNTSLHVPVASRWKTVHIKRGYMGGGNAGLRATSWQTPVQSSENLIVVEDRNFCSMKITDEIEFPEHI